MDGVEAPLRARRTRHRPRRRRAGVDRVDHVDLVNVLAEARRLPDFEAHQEVWEVRDDAVGLHGFIAIHDTSLGPALGGCRMAPYASRTAALTDALRLSRAMTSKAALAGFDLGGGKAVLIGGPGAGPSEALFRSFGAAVDSFGGEYVTGEDVGTSVREIDWIATRTAHVIGTSAHGGDPSEMTALGVCEGVRAAVRHRLGRSELSGLTVAVQGLGHVGQALCRRLAHEGARLVVADLDRGRVAHLRAELDAVIAAPERIHAAEAEVFAPCAMGGVLDDRTIPELRCAVVAGCANNQLARGEHGEVLRRRGILLAPDYVINAGGLISVALGLYGEDPNGAPAHDRVCRIGATLAEIFHQADARAVTPHQIADALAAARIARRRADREGGR